MRFIKKNTILEDIQQMERPIHQLDEISAMHERVIENLNKELKIPKDILDSFKLKSELNKEFWKGDKLLPNIKSKLITITKDFFKSLELPPNIKIKDILFVGSLANYNWSKYSDVDIHLVLDFKEIDSDTEQAKQRLDAQKNLWNLKHDITIDEYPVELYVQDQKEKLESSAIYSILNDKWVLMPEREKFKLDKSVIKNKVNKFFEKIKEIKYNYDTRKYKKVIRDAEKLKKQIKTLRQSGLEQGGEFSTENLVFKVLRRTDFMEILDNYNTKAYDKSVTIKENTP
jgi:hypothetical protein